MLRTLLCSFTCGFSSILERFRRRFYEACFIVVFFFRAEDGIRDLYVTGVQTCALPILRDAPRIRRSTRNSGGQTVRFRIVLRLPEIGRATRRERVEISGGAGSVKQ